MREAGRTARPGWPQAALGYPSCGGGGLPDDRLLAAKAAPGGSISARVARDECRVFSPGLALNLSACPSVVSFVAQRQLAGPVDPAGPVQRRVPQPLGVERNSPKLIPDDQPHLGLAQQVSVFVVMPVRFSCTRSTMAAWADAASGSGVIAVVNS